MLQRAETLSEFVQQHIPRNGAGDASDLESLWRNGTLPSDRVAALAAEYYGLPRADFSAVSKAPAAFKDLSRRFLREGAIFPFEGEDGIALAVADPGRREALRAVRLALGAMPPLAVVSFEEIDFLFERSNEAGEAAAPVVSPDGASEEGPAESIDSLQDLARGAPIVRIIDGILERAVEAGATDIHFETERDGLRVRLRVDGMLRREQKLALNLAPAVISRLKILAGLDIADRRLPQDGRANLRVGSVEADLRVAVMPTVHGETAVLRILLRDSRLLDFARIGMTDKDRRAFERLLAEPYGMIVVTGPTGSGKTTTLATAVSLLNDPARKIVTIEDPIEYQIAGIHQTQVKPGIGLTFASALRSFLRHDPDIIMVGEMRDGETAGIGVQAALTGHLVLTTLHTNSAADAIVRLADMGVEPYLIGASLRGVLGQRLVRKLCERCKKPDERAEDALRRLAEARGFALGGGGLECCTAPGCEACGHSGFRGRIGIFEVLPADEKLRALVRQRADPEIVAEHGRLIGMTTMFEDGLSKCARGATTVEEVLRATG